MMGQSEQEIAQVIEDEIAGYHDSEQRYARLMKHSAELADRWIGFATVGTISARARVANDLFRALQVSLQMTLDSLRGTETRTKTRDDLELLISKASRAAQSSDNAAIEGLIDLLNSTLLVDLSRP